MPAEVSGPRSAPTGPGGSRAIEGAATKGREAMTRSHRVERGEQPRGNSGDD